MSNQALARKWRPRQFADVVGQEHILKALVHALDRLAIPVLSLEKGENSGQLTLDADALSALLDQNVPRPLIIGVRGSASANATRIVVRRANDTVDSSDPAVAVLQFLYQQLK